MRQFVTRQVDQGVMIGDEIEVTVLEIGPTFVRLSVNDPRSEPACREHLLFLEEEPLEVGKNVARPRFR